MTVRSVYRRAPRLVVAGRSPEPPIGTVTVPRHDGRVVEGWNPWRALRERGELTELWFAPLDGRRGLWVRRHGCDEIYLDERLDRRERRAVLAHELIHAERGIGLGAASDATMVKEEQCVWREVIRRLAPPAEVDRFLRRERNGDGVSVDELADEFDLPPDVASRLAILIGATVEWRPGPGPNDGGRGESGGATHQ